MIRFASTLLKFGLGALILLGVLGAVAVAISLASLPGFEEMQRSPKGQTVVVKAADGSLLVTLGPSFGEWLAFDRIPPTMVNAMIAVEDRRFYRHPGLDPIGIARALWVNLQPGGRVEGASTITQQLARNIFLTQERSFARKLREAILAVALEARFSKRAILELYLNRVYFGGGAYGIDAASRRFFGHPATRLSLPEAAIIAGLVKAPSRYAPSADPARARGRAATVLAVMAQSGAITSAEAAAADMGALRFAPQPRQTNVRYFTDWVLGQLEALSDETVEPLEVLTTLNPQMQRAAEAAIARATPAGTQGALVAMSHDGAVRAMVGGRDYVSSNYNRATVAVRQPGSAFKLFVYLAALEDGVEPEAIMRDEPITIDGWSPRNSSRAFAGDISVRDAFARSINTVAVALAQQTGFGTVADMARRFGITTPIDRRPAMALGSSEVRLIELTQAYAGVASGGVETRPFGIVRVETWGGRLVWEREPGEPRALVAPDVAARMTGLMKAAVETGTGRQAQMGRELAGKTGTTSANKDAWFLGFTSDLVAGVWMGRDDGRAVPGLAGAGAPARAFAAFMRAASRGRPAGTLNTEVPPADGFVEPDAEAYGLGGEPVAIDPATGETILSGDGATEASPPPGPADDAIGDLIPVPVPVPEAAPPP